MHINFFISNKNFSTNFFNDGDNLGSNLHHQEF